VCKCVCGERVCVSVCVESESVWMGRVSGRDGWMGRVDGMGKLG
jgi:hypothetical protein